MLVSTRGIVFNKIKYSDNKFIAKIYTEHFGLQSYIVYDNTKRRNSRMLGYFSILDIVTFNKYNRYLQQIKEVSLNYIHKNIPFDIRKSTIAMFLIDIVNACIKEHEPNQQLFDFLYNSVVELDNADSGLAYFHLQFMIKFSEYLGCKPENNYSEQRNYFDIAEGCFTNLQPKHQYFLNTEQAFIFHNLINSDNEFDIKTNLNTELRDKIMISLIDYYKIHLPGMGKINSINILKELLA